MDDFKKATVKDYTSWDLNCRRILPHDKYSNKLEKRIKRKARRIFKQNLKKVLTFRRQYGIIKIQKGR